jgi:hypothetical protein
MGHSIDIKRRGLPSEPSRRSAAYFIAVLAALEWVTDLMPSQGFDHR